MNPYFTKDLADHRHSELMAQAEQSRRYHAAVAARAGAPRAHSRRGGAARRPLRAMHAWLVAGVL